MNVETEAPPAVFCSRPQCVSDHHLGFGCVHLFMFLSKQPSRSQAACLSGLAVANGLDRRDERMERGYRKTWWERIHRRSLA